jgi:hypothetical protein
MTFDALVEDLDADASDRPAMAIRLEVKEYKSEIPVHRHRKSQLVLALRAAVTGQVEKALSRPSQPSRLQTSDGRCRRRHRCAHR